VRRGPYAKVTARNADLLERIRTLKAEHPFWEVVGHYAGLQARAWHGWSP
jgi:hypothetical protein